MSIWLLAGIVFVLAVLIVLLPWLRTVPQFTSLPVLPWQAGAGALLTIGAIAALYVGSGRSIQASASGDTDRLTMLGSRGAAVQTSGSGLPLPGGDARAGASVMPASAGATGAGPDSATWADIEKNLSNVGAAPGSRGAGAAAPMAAAVASLQRRLARGGGSTDDWELLARSYEFLGRPAEAKKARAHQLPALPVDVGAGAAEPADNESRPTSEVALDGDVTVSPELKAAAPADATLFIVAKATDSPGPPVAVVRMHAGNWPAQFKLTDSQAMLPGRTLSSAGRVTVEARISRSGQPLPAVGDLQGSSGVVDPAAHTPLHIVIDRSIK